MTVLFSLFEIIFATTIPPPWLHIPFLLLLLLLYVSLAYLTHAAQGFYTYSFLDPGVNGAHSGRVAAYAFAILAALLVVFGLVRLAIWQRRRIVGPQRVKWSLVAGVNVRRGVEEGNGDMEHV